METRTKRPSDDGREDMATVPMLSTPTPRLAPTPSLAGLSQESTAAQEHLTDPYDGSTIGALLPVPSAPAEHPLATPGEAGTPGEELWAQLSRVLELQTDIARTHADMEGNNASKGKAKTGESKDRSSSKGHGQSQTDPGTEDYDVEGEGMEMDDEETERNRAREEEFAKLADQFERRKESINDIMNKLDDLSKALTEFHALQAPEVKMPSRSHSMGIGIYDPPPSSRMGIDPPPSAVKLTHSLSRVP
ncbi:hypothetical protein APHAL10511_006003 [Amanita phalloides]|nr:hypothetical protein APHAL10511_006003 [Amanita phalloides]